MIVPWEDELISLFIKRYPLLCVQLTSPRITEIILFFWFWTDGNDGSWWPASCRATGRTFWQGGRKTPQFNEGTPGWNKRTHVSCYLSALHLSWWLRMFRPVRDTLWFLRLLPVFLIVSLLVQYCYRKFHQYTKSSNQECLLGFSDLVKRHGGPTILTFNVSRLFGCIGLLLTAVCLEVRDLSNTRML